jgi:hypothetical protein
VGAPLCTQRGEQKKKRCSKTHCGSNSVQVPPSRQQLTRGSRGAIQMRRKQLLGRWQNHDERKRNDREDTPLRSRCGKFFLVRFSSVSKSIMPALAAALSWLAFACKVMQPNTTQILKCTKKNLVLDSDSTVSDEHRTVDSQIYKDHHLLIWDAIHNEETGSWTPSIIISWIVNDRYQFHKFEGAAQRSRAAALTLGKQLAEEWVDRQNETI